MSYLSALTIQYSVRNLFRYKQRTALTIGTIALSTIVTIIGFQYADAVLVVWKEGAIDHGAGHAQIHKSDFYTFPDILNEKTLIKDDGLITNLLKNDAHIAGFSQRIIFEGIISFGRKTMYFQGRGIEATDEAVVSPGLFNQEVMSGQFVDEKYPHGITIGKGLADAIEAKVGDEVTLMTNTVGGAVNGIDVTISGIIDFPVPSISKRLLYMNMSAAQKALSIDQHYSEIAIRLKAGTDSEKWVTEFAQKLKKVDSGRKFDLRGWWQIEPLIRKVQEIWHSVMGIIIVLLFSTAAVSVLNIVYLLVAERMVEIGTLMSLGAKPATISTLFALEASTMGVFGSLLGSGLANVILFFLNRIGVPFDSPFASGSLTIHPEPDLFFSGIVFIFGVGICFFSALLPAKKASKVPPIAAFRGQIT